MSDDNPADDSFFDVSGLPGEKEDTSDTLVGTVLDGRFRLERVLGEGGMGKVYAGTQLSVGREVAVKLLRSEALVQHEVKERFLREARLISGFNHPNIVRLIDYGEDAERTFPYLVMELVGGISLGELTRRGRLAVPLALEICDQVCAALIQAHAAGIVHRDLKPDNLKLLPVMGDSFQVKVLDFGIAFPRDANSRLTSTGMICGTSYYIAPEQARAWELDGRADLYALGIILFEMLSGHLPFRGDSDFQILLKQVQQPPPSLTNFLAPDEVPLPIIELVHELLEKDPEARPNSAREVRERIAQLRRDCDIPALDLDLEEASVEAFDQWLLPREEDSALAEASTAFDAATPAEALEQLVNDADLSQPHPTRPDHADKGDHADIKKGDSGQTELPPDPIDAGGSPAQADPRPPSRRGRWVALAAAVLLLAGAWSVWASYGHILQGPGDGEAGGDEDGELDGKDGHDGKDGADKPAATAPIALDAFAGGCRILGESGAWFHTVFFYPEVGEVLLWGDAQMVWSPVELGERDGQDLGFSYEHPDRDGPQDVRVRASGDKLVIRTDEDPKFVCRLDPEQRYFDPLDAAGPFWRDVDDAQSEDGKATLEIAETGQRLEADGASYVYRILSGHALDDGVQIAVREADDREAAWSLWQLELDDGELTVERGNKATRYLTRERRTADRKASKKSTQKKKTITKAPKPPTPPTPAIPEPPTAPPKNSGKSEKSASSEEVAHYRKKIEALGDRCAELISKMKANIAHLDKLQDEERYDELEEFSQTMQDEQKRYSDRLRDTSKEYSQLMTEITLSDFDRAQMVGLSSIYTNKCTWE
ncbi:MAG: serine/threonine-protein kinase [Persicimonas sp.]